jgi:hypothetical protein
MPNYLIDKKDDGKFGIQKYNDATNQYFDMGVFKSGEFTTPLFDTLQEADNWLEENIGDLDIAITGEYGFGDNEITI